MSSKRVFALIMVFVSFSSVLYVVPPAVCVTPATSSAVSGSSGVVGSHYSVQGSSSNAGASIVDSGIRVSALPSGETSAPVASVGDLSPGSTTGATHWPQGIRWETAPSSDGVAKDPGGQGGGAPKAGSARTIDERGSFGPLVPFSAPTPLIASNSPVITLPVGSGPFAVGVDSATDTIYVANEGANSVSVIDGASNTVTFTESGLASGTSWSVTLNGTTNTSTTSTLMFTEPNGTYGYTVNALSGYTVSPSSGSVTVKGSAPTPVSVTFTKTSPASFLGLPGSEGYFVVGVIVAAIAEGILILLILWKRTPTRAWIEYFSTWPEKTSIVLQSTGPSANLSRYRFRRAIGEGEPSGEYNF